MSNLTKCLNAINLKNKSYVYKKSDCSGFMLMMFFSHDKKCLPIVERINDHLFDVEDLFVYNYLYKAIPRSNRYLKWDHGKKDKLKATEKKVIQQLQDDHEISVAEATTLFLRYIQ
jgi:hypothetical protein